MLFRFNQTVAYGTAVTTVTGNGSYTATGFVNGENTSVISGSVTYSTSYTATTAVGTAGVTITPNVSGLSATNYSFTGANGTITIGKTNLTITARDTSRVYGSVLTGGAGSTRFTSSGLLNGETIGSVTIAYSTTGNTATDTVRVYTGAVTASAATGGTFEIGRAHV